MSRDLNRVMVIGRLGKDPELKYTPSGSAMARFSVASSRKWRSQEGEDREDTEWFNIVAWDKLAETCGQYLTKGARVYLEGRLQTRSWDDQETGQKRYMTEVVIHDMIMLDSKKQQGDSPANEEEEEPTPAPAKGSWSGRRTSTPVNIPAKGGTAQPRKFAAAAPPATDEEEFDLPF
jgi:single-strand DNA-binding protein